MLLRVLFRGLARALRGAPGVSLDEAALLDDVQPPTRAELELYVPEAVRNLGEDWIFTRGKVLAFTESIKTRTVGSVAGFDVAQEFDEAYSVYSGVYGYRDHRGQLQTFRMAPTENDRMVRPGRAFIICFNRRAPRRHHLFTMVRPTSPR